MNDKEKHQHRARGGATLWAILIILGAAVTVTAVVLNRRSAVVPVRAAEVTRGTIVSTIATNGKIEPVDDFEAHAPAAITVKKVLVKNGDSVRAGQLLVELDDATARADAAHAQAQLAAAKADLHAVRQGGTHEEVLNTQAQLAKARSDRDTAQRNLDALQRLLQKGAASPDEVQAARVRLSAAENEIAVLEQKQTSRYSRPEVERVEAEQTQARASLAAAEDLLKHTNIRAPRDGEVYNVPVRNGQFVNSGDLLVGVANLDEVLVRAFVDEPDLGKVKIGETVLLTWDALPGQQWNGTVSRVPTTVIQKGTRTVGETGCIIDNPGRKLLPNIDVNVTIVTAERNNVLTLPREAVHQDANGQRFVYHIEHGVIDRHNVQTGISNLTSIEIVEGIPDHAEVTLGAVNNRSIDAGSRVRVVGR
jgi:HlyD family secretion protein